MDDEVWAKERTLIIQATMEMKKYRPRADVNVIEAYTGLYPLVVAVQMRQKWWAGPSLPTTKV